MERAAAYQNKTWCMSEVEIFRDLSPAEMDAIGAAVPMRTYPAGTVVFSPHEPVEALFIVKKGRVRVFRVSAEGRALTTAIVTPGNILGEMALVGQRMYDNFAETLTETVLCVMSRADVQRHLLGDQRIAARITETLGRRLQELERRLSDTVFKNVPQRIASTLVTLTTEEEARRGPAGRRGAVVALTHEQVAALTGTSRETATKVLGEFADQGLIKLNRGRITILDPVGIQAESGD